MQDRLEQTFDALFADPALESQELLLLNPAFVTGDLVSALVNCVDTNGCRSKGVPGFLHEVFKNLKFCGDSINLDKPVSKAFQGFDCYGQGTNTLSTSKP